jgi:hypothetical protein
MDLETRTVFHYTNSKAYERMQVPESEHYFSQENYPPGITPNKKFVSRKVCENLPRKVYEYVFEGLLEPEPISWIKNKEFPNLWEYLMRDFMRDLDNKDTIILLNFHLTRNDEAYIVDRAHIERELYRESKGLGKSTKKTMNKAITKYWNSRIHALDYEGGYNAPQYAIWSPIAFERINVVWKKTHDEVWKKVLENN